MKNSIFTKTIVLLSLVSLLTDISSEMLYPVMPMFLSSIGFSALYIGVLEGIAEAVAGFSKGYFGRVSDRTGRRAIFVQSGYFLSSIAKPMMALISHPLWILFARITDRAGKGLRTGARDAILSGETSPEFKGRVFGFHRAFDTVGAAIGPFIALIYLSFYPENYRELFFIAFVPALLGVGFTFFLKDKKDKDGSDTSQKIDGTAKQIPVKKAGFFDFLKYWGESSSQYKKLVVGLIVFAVVNSSDALLLLAAKNRGIGDANVIIVYIFYNLVYALLSYPIGYLGDKIGLKYSFIFGLVVFACVYALAAFATSIEAFFILFFLYGFYAAATEGISKAWITNLAREKDAATAVGFYSSWQSIATLVASSLAGVIWVGFGLEFAFLLSSIVAILVAIYLLLMFKGTKIKSVNEKTG